MLAERVREWTKPWFEQGRQEGRQEGESGILLRLLELRFGELPASLVMRVQSADSKQLKVWAEAVLTAGTLAEVFNNDQG